MSEHCDLCWLWIWLNMIRGRCVYASEKCPHR